MTFKSELSQFVCAECFTDWKHLVPPNKNHHSNKCSWKKKIKKLQKPSLGDPSVRFMGTGCIAADG